MPKLQFSVDGEELFDVDSCLTNQKEDYTEIKVTMTDERALNVLVNALETGIGYTFFTQGYSVHINELKSVDADSLTLICLGKYKEI